LLDGYKKKEDRMKETEDILKVFKEKGLHVEISPQINVNSKEVVSSERPKKYGLKLR